MGGADGTQGGKGSELQGLGWYARKQQWRCGHRGERPMNETAIAWTQKTWNPASGCVKITEGCKYCYAHTLAEQKRGTAAFPNGFDLTIRPHKLAEPRRLKEPSLVFVNSMSDL